MTRLLPAPFAAFSGIVLACSTAAAAPIASRQGPAKVTVPQTAQCLLGHWLLDLVVIKVGGEVFGSGEQGALVTFSKGPVFSASGPLLLNVNYNPSGYLTEMGGFTRTKTTGSLEGEVRVSKGHLVSAGPFEDDISIRQQVNLAGKWGPWKPAATSGGPAPSAADDTFAGWDFVCNPGSMVLTYAMGGTGGLSWTLFRKPASKKS